MRMLLGMLGLLALLALPVAAQDDALPTDLMDELRALGESVITTYGGTDTAQAGVTSGVLERGMFAGLAYSRGADGAFILGDPDAPLTLIEFADFACPHCQDYRPTVDQFIEDYVRTGAANFEMRIFPTAGGEMTVYAASLAECADEASPGAFWLAYEQLYALAEDNLYNAGMASALARTLDLDAKRLTSCADQVRQIATDVDYGLAYGVQGTPAILVRQGEGAAAFITLDGRTYNSGGVPFDVLEDYMASLDV